MGHRGEHFRVNGHGRVHVGDEHYHINPSPTQLSPFHNKYFEVPRDPSAAFTGREDVLEELRVSCLPSSTSAGRRQKRYVIHGLGGSGKTQICLKFVEDHREEFWGVFWLDASSIESLERGYLHIANVCGLETKVDIVRRWLSNAPESWALILDNADNPRLDLSPYFPAGNRGVILITSRNPECRVHATVGSYELGAMSEDEAVTLMLKTVRIIDLSNQSMRETARSVVLTLGRLALAITQAGAVIRQGRCPMDEYCSLYAKRRKELLSQKAIQAGDDYRYTVYTTWEVSRQMIKDMSSEAGRDALELLQTFSFLHYEGIPEEIFSRACHVIRDEWASPCMLSHLPGIVLRQSMGGQHTDNIRTAISVLLSFSLVYRSKEDLISMHPLVHTWVQDRLDPSEEETVWLQTTSTLALSIPSTTGKTEFPFLKALVSHVDTCLSFQSDRISFLKEHGVHYNKIAGRFALVYYYLGHFQKGLGLMKQVVEFYTRTLGEEHFDTLDSMYTLANFHGRVGDSQMALQLAEDVAKVYEKRFDEEDPKVLDLRHSMSRWYGSTGQEQNALPLAERVAEARKKTLGEEHPDTLSSMEHIACIYFERGEKQKGLMLVEQVAEVYTRTLGEEHPLTLNSMCNLAVCQSVMGEIQKALQLAERVVDRRKELLGEEHPDTFRSINRLVIIYANAGDKRGALQLGERSVEKSKSMLGEEHPITQEALYLLHLIKRHPHNSDSR